jgi:hypothetical protein
MGIAPCALRVLLHAADFAAAAERCLAFVFVLYAAACPVGRYTDENTTRTCKQAQKGYFVDTVGAKVSSH